MKNVTGHNLEPSYLTGTQALSKDVMKSLMELVDNKGAKSTWSYNPDCTELQIANPFSVARKNDAKTISVLPELFALGESCMRQMNRVFTNSAFEYISGHHGFWVLRYDEGGKFDPHCDWDSGPNGIRPPVVATACVMLNDDFEGGETYIIGHDQSTTTKLKREVGDIVMWDGYTEHAISPIKKGTRYVLVIHYTGNIK